MELLLALAVVVVVVALLVFRNSATKGLEVLDVNKNGKVDLEDAKVAVQNVVESVKKTADVNKDGKISLVDAKIVVASVAKKANNVMKKTVAKKSSAKSNRKS